MAMGAVAECHLLVDPLGLGNKSCGFAAGADFLACAGDGRRRWLATLVCLWPAVGRRRADQHVALGVSACLRTLRLVSPRQARQAFMGWDSAGVRRFPLLYHALADPQPPHLRPLDLYSLEL